MDFSPSRRTVLAACVCSLLAAGRPLAAGEAGEQKAKAAPRVNLPKPGEHDACPVCGMFVARYHEWVATMVFANGEAVHFDGAKDFFKFWLDMKKYDPHGHTQEDVVKMGVTAYYSTEMIDARAALYVIGSDVLGPMGHELIPHPDMYDAREFMKDHKGKAIVRFDDVDMEMLKGLDKGKFIVHGKELK